MTIASPSTKKVKIVYAKDAELRGPVLVLATGPRNSTQTEMKCGFYFLTILAVDRTYVVAK